MESREVANPVDSSSLFGGAQFFGVGVLFDVGDILVPVYA